MIQFFVESIDQDQFVDTVVEVSIKSPVAGIGVYTFLRAAVLLNSLRI